MPFWACPQQATWHPLMRNYFAQEVPFGHAKTAAYLVFGLADVSDLEAGRWREAEALVSLLLSASEQAALQEWSWTLAWLLTFSAEPPWTKIRVQPPSHTDLRAVARLADPELMAAAVGHLKDMMSIAEAQKKASPPPLSEEGPRVPRPRPAAARDVPLAARGSLRISSSSISSNTSSSLRRRGRLQRRAAEPLRSKALHRASRRAPFHGASWGTDCSPLRRWGRTPCRQPAGGCS